MAQPQSASSALFLQLSPIRTVLFNHNDPASALSQLKAFQYKRGLPAAERRAIYELIGLCHRQQHQWQQAQQIYGELGDYYQAGYCALLGGSFQDALKWWQQLVQKVNPHHWAVSLSGMLAGNMQHIPSMLQIRNYLEQDVYALADAGQVSLLNNVLNCAPILLQINPEAPKLMGRALLHANQPETAVSLLLLGQQTVPNDVEVYFHLGQCYQALGNIPAAQRCLNQCLLMSPDFRPAQWLLDSLVTPPSPQ